MTLAQGIEQVAVAADLHSGNLGKLVYVLAVCLRILYCHSLVGTPGRDDLDSERLLKYLLVVAQVVGRVVGGADGLDVEFAYERLTAVFRCRKFGVALFEDVACSGRGEQFVNVKHSLQLKVSPVVKRIAHSIRHGFRPLAEFLPGTLVSGDIFFRNTVSAHSAPFVMVSAQPEFSNVTELVVLCNHLRNEMAVVVDDGHSFGCLVVKLAGCLPGQHKIFVYK